MKIVSTDSKLWWLSVADEIRPLKGLPVVDAVGKFGEAFKFAARPTALPGPTDGYHFSEGSITVDDGSNIAIKEVAIFNDGLSVEVYSNTDDLLATLDKVLEVVRGIGFRVPTTQPRIVFNSFITVDLDGNMNRIINRYDPLSQLMSEVFGVETRPDAKVIEFGVDPKLGTPLNSTSFRLERRMNTEYSINRYFSYANATTKDHLRLLEAVEAGLAPAN